MIFGWRKASEQLNRQIRFYSSPNRDVAESVWIADGGTPVLTQKKII
jgi:hypothetical protein